MRDAIERRSRTFLALLLSAVMFSTALLPINSRDFWWHLQSGQYMLERGRLMEADPFTYTAAAEDPAAPGRPGFILKQYWLAQVIFASVVNAAGLEGLIVFRALLFVGMGLGALGLCISLGARRAWPLTFVLLALAARVALEDSDRPQNFSYLLCLLMVLIVEWAIRSRKAKLLWLNVPVMLVSANLHGGYVVGLVYLLVYAVFAFREERLRPLRRTLVMTGIAAFLAAWLNPNHLQALVGTLSMSVGVRFAAGALENASPLEILGNVWASPGWLAYYVLAALSVPATLYHLLKRRWSAAVLLGGTLAASLLAMRHIYFFVPLGSAFCAVFLEETVFARLRPRPLAEAVVGCLVLLLPLISPYHENHVGIRATVRERTYPVGAAEFLAREALPRRVFNLMGWGGYLEWRLWPEYEMFIDTRVLNDQTGRDYNHILSASSRGRKLLETYDIGTVVTRGINYRLGQIYPLVLALADDPEWSLLYADGEALVFSRAGSHAAELPASEAYFQILSEVRYWRSAAPWAEGFERSEAEARRRLGLGR